MITAHARGVRIPKNRVVDFGMPINDLGVKYSTTGLHLLQVQHEPGIGQYVVTDTGYLFSNREDRRRVFQIYCARPKPI